MPHFFINSNQKTDNKITICDKENYQHIARALRARCGEKLLLIDENQIQYETTIAEITNSKITVDIDKFYQSKRFLDFDLYLAQSPLRSDAQGMLIEKATELGVCGVYPVLTDNCALNKSVAEKKLAKWNKIMYEASKQCERAFVPVCYDVTDIDRVINENSFDKIIVFCERIADKTIRDSFVENPIKKGDNVLVIIGPEGGFSQREFNYFKDKKDIFLHSLKLCFETAFTPMLNTLKQFKPPFNFDSILREFIPLCLKAHNDNKIAHQELLGICVLDNDAGLLLQQMENQAIQSICEYLLSNGINLPHLMEKTQIAYHIIEEYCHDVMLEKYYQTDFDIMFEVVITTVKNIYLQ